MAQRNFTLVLLDYHHLGATNNNAILLSLLHQIKIWWNEDIILHEPSFILASSTNPNYVFDLPKCIPHILLWPEALESDYLS